jgi:hypothetical protein
MNILAARRYHTPRNGPPTADQAETRRLAYSIKSTASPCVDFDTAAREMAALILASNPQPSTLNPQPSTLNQLTAFAPSRPAPGLLRDSFPTWPREHNSGLPRLLDFIAALM